MDDNREKLRDDDLRVTMGLKNRCSGMKASEKNRIYRSRKESMFSVKNVLVFFFFFKEEKKYLHNSPKTRLWLSRD